ncbi:Fe2+-dicitrate sensor, membrane component [Opitutaceae bacterium TAV1]|nr:Fe2+-dicitrate sensor, membrane component [Opitutaceae bacterium TAV1]
MRPVDEERAAFYSLALRYLVGEATSEERERLVALLQQPDLQKMFDDMDAAWCEDPKNWEEGFDLDGASRKVLDAIDRERTAAPLSPAAAAPADKDDATSPSPAPRPSRRRFWLAGIRKRCPAPAMWAGIAGAVAAIALTFGIVFQPNRSPGTVSNTESDNTWIEQTNGVGERLVLTLGDGTNITLNAGSSLLYPKSFGSRNRVVRLSGEAFFDVAHDQTRPFIVETSTMRITVLGTRFNVKAFSDGTKAQVTLVQGRVEVTPVGGPAVSATPANPVTLTAGMQYTLAPATHTGRVTAAADEDATGWISDRIVWNREPLPDAMRELERRYGIIVEMTDARLANETVTGRFQSESIQNIFKLLAATGGIDYRIVDNNGKVERVILHYVSTGNGQ